MLTRKNTSVTLAIGVTSLASQAATTKQRSATFVPAPSPPTDRRSVLRKATDRRAPSDGVLSGGTLDCSSTRVFAAASVPTRKPELSFSDREVVDRRMLSCGTRPGCPAGAEQGRGPRSHRCSRSRSWWSFNGSRQPARRRPWVRATEPPKPVRLRRDFRRVLGPLSPGQKDPRLKELTHWLTTAAISGASMTRTVKWRRS